MGGFLPTPDGLEIPNAFRIESRKFGQSLGRPFFKGTQESGAKFQFGPHQASLHITMVWGLRIFMRINFSRAQVHQPEQMSEFMDKRRALHFSNRNQGIFRYLWV